MISQVREISSVVMDLRDTRLERGPRVAMSLVSTWLAIESKPDDAEAMAVSYTLSYSLYSALTSPSSQSAGRRRRTWWWVRGRRWGAEVGSNKSMVVRREGRKEGRKKEDASTRVCTYTFPPSSPQARRVLPFLHSVTCPCGRDHWRASSLIRLHRYRSTILRTASGLLNAITDVMVV
jgi:hypothetical protein